MRVPLNVIFIWSGTNAAIPSGYSRKTDLDGRYPKGGASPNVTGGDLTHTHTSAGHTHALSAHTHTVSLNAIVRDSLKSGDTTAGGPGKTHGHVAVNSGAKSGGLLNSATSTYSAINHEPPYYEVIFIKSDGSRGVPDSVIGLSDSATIPTNWKKCDGNNSTPNLTDKYLKGASAGADAGGTGGALTHTEHTITHTHTEAGHTHSRVESGTYTSVTEYETASGTADAVLIHSHHIDLNSNTLSYSGVPLSGTGANEPLYKKLLAIQNQNDQDSVPKGIIGMWTGTIATIPVGWEEVIAMRSYHLKITNTTGDIENTGGSNTHTHSDSHSHTGNSHNHGATVETQALTNNSINDADKDVPKAHTHAATVGNTSASWGTSNTSANSSNNEPSYRTVAFIKLIQTADAGFLMNFL